MTTLTLPLPPDLDEAAARLIYAIGLFQSGHVSVGKAAEIAGRPYRDFLGALHERGIPAYVYDEEAFTADTAFLQRQRERGST